MSKFHLHNNPVVDSDEICGLCHKKATPEFHRDFIHYTTREAKSHNYCSYECLAESYEFQDEDITARGLSAEEQEALKATVRAERWKPRYY